MACNPCEELEEDLCGPAEECAEIPADESDACAADVLCVQPCYEMDEDGEVTYLCDEDSQECHIQESEGDYEETCT